MDFIFILLSVLLVDVVEDEYEILDMVNAKSL